MEEKTAKKVMLSGIQPSGDLTLGSYLGAIKNWSERAEIFDCYYFMADLHSITVRQNPADLRRRTIEQLAQYIACGLDPEKNTLFIQSHVPAHTQLGWVLNCYTMFGELSRMTQFKDKSAKNAENINGGLFTYPVLMAADILMYDSDLVPVGKDQKQHLEVTRDLAGKMNEQFGEGTCKLPDALIAESTAIVPGLDGQKMSKSYNNTLPIFGEEKTVRKLIMRIPTDSTPVEDPKPTEGSVILQLYKLFASAQGYEDMVRGFQNGGCGYGDFKKRLFDAYWEYFRPARERRAELEANQDYVRRTLEEGARKARETASVVLDRVRRAVGLA